MEWLPNGWKLRTVTVQSSEVKLAEKPGWNQDGTSALRSAQLNATQGPLDGSSCFARLYAEGASERGRAHTELHGRNLFWFRAAQSIRDFVRDAWKFMIFSFVCSSCRSREKFIRCTLFKNTAQRHGTRLGSCVSAMEKKEKNNEKRNTILKYYRGSPRPCYRIFAREKACV